MFGLPMLIVFGGLAWLSASRGWNALAMVFFACFAIGLADTVFGTLLYNGVATALRNVWAAIARVLNQVAA